MSEASETKTDSRLTEEDYWKSHLAAAADAIAMDSPSARSKRRFASGFFAPVASGFSRYLLYDVVAPRYLPKGNHTLIEVGSAPGRELIAMRERFGYEPFGVEYTDNGVEVNRRIFVEHDLKPENIIHADFFDPKFQETNRERFNVVMSHGFIEHFTDLTQVIDCHVNLLKPGGSLFITVPNFRWLNYLLIRFFARDTIATHNLSIMKRKNFRACFERNDLEIVACKYLGTVNFGIIWGMHKSRFKIVLMNILMKVQRVFDLTLYLFFRRGGPETALFSPKLVAICRKK